MIPGASHALPSLRRSRDSGSPRGAILYPRQIQIDPYALGKTMPWLRFYGTFSYSLYKPLTSLEQRTNAQDERCQIHNYPLSKKSKRP
jgi:hypothetical protein